MLTRRNFVLGCSAAASAAAMGSEQAQGGPLLLMPAVIFAAWHDRTFEDHVAQAKKYSDLGYQTQSLSVYRLDTTAGFKSFYAAVMVKRAWQDKELQVLDYTRDAFLKRLDEWKAVHYKPTIISASGHGDDATYSAVATFRPNTTDPIVRVDLTAAQFLQQNFDAMLAGKVLVWADSNGDPGVANSVLFAGIWDYDDKSIAWSCNDGQTNSTLNDLPDVTQEIFHAQLMAGARLAHMAPTSSGGYLTVYQDNQVGKWEAIGEMSSADYQTAFNTYTKIGLYPSRVMVKSTDKGQVFAALFQERDSLTPRNITFSQTTPSVKAIEDLLNSVITAGDVRGISLAVTKGPKLVYAKGVSFGEPDYPQVLPETSFRLASISKLLCSVGLYAHYQNAGHDFSADPKMNSPLNTTMQSILNIAPPPKLPGKPAPVQDPNWAKVKLRDLLESTSAINFATPWASFAASAAFGTPLPATTRQLLSWASVQTFTATPGDPNNCVYGNDGYLVLGDVLRKLENTTDMDGAIQKLVCKPLGLKNTHASRSTVGEQPAGEARYHQRNYAVDEQGNPTLLPLTVWPSCTTVEQPWVPSHYGSWWEYETAQGCGGMSSSAVDLARIIAMFNSPTQTPLLSTAAMNAMINNAKAATAVLTGPNPREVHGFHGLDFCRVESNGSLHMQKGGWIPSHECLIDWYKDGYGVVMLVNGNKRREANLGMGGQTVNWLDALYKIVEGIDWKEDLFPHFGMPSLEGSAKPNGPAWMTSDALPKDAQILGREAASMTAAAAKHPVPRLNVRPRLARPAGPMRLQRPMMSVPVMRPRGR